MEDKNDKLAQQVRGKPFQKGDPRINRSGRKTGTRNKLTVEQLEAVKSSGITPLEFLLSVMRDENESLTTRIDVAKAAAPYIHRKMPLAIESNRDNGLVEILQTINANLGKEERERRTT